MVFSPETISLAESLMGSIEADWAWIYQNTDECTRPHIVDNRLVSTPARFPLDWPVAFQQRKANR